MRILVDTQSFYWSLCDPGALTGRAAAALTDPGISKYLSAVVFWELAIKHALGKLILPKPVEVLWAEAEDVALILPIRPSHLRCLGTLLQHHRDPFDRLMIAQALEEGWEVVSSDDQWDAYGVVGIW